MGRRTAWLRFNLKMMEVVIAPSPHIPLAHASHGARIQARLVPAPQNARPRAISCVNSKIPVPTADNGA